MSEKESGMIQAYRDSVCILSYDLALLALMAERVGCGKLTNAEYAMEILAKVKGDTAGFLDARAAIGLGTGKDALAAFTEDHFFDGFSVQKGRFSGDRQNAGRVCGEWIHEMHLAPSEEEAARFEYGMYMLMLSGSAQMVFCQLASGRQKVHKSTIFEWLGAIYRRVWEKVSSIFRNINNKQVSGHITEQKFRERKRIA